MQTRSILLMGLVLANLAGCQSYFPNGYSNAGPYSAFPQGGYGPPPGVVSPPTTYQPGRMPPPGQITTEGTLNNKYAPSNGQNNNVPNPREAGAPPSSLGTPANEEEETIRRGTSSLEKPPARLSGLTDDSEENLAAFGDEDFAAPKQIESAGAIDDGDSISRKAQKPRRNPYKYDKRGYAWLRGTISRDANAGGWRLRYSQDPLAEEDNYGGSFMLVGDDKIETLVEDDVVLVQGRIDPSARDRNGKPMYRVDNLTWVKPIE